MFIQKALLVANFGGRRGEGGLTSGFIIIGQDVIWKKFWVNTRTPQHGKTC